MNTTTASPQTTEVGKLLLNAWSAEFALRIKPVTTNRSYLNSSLNWVTPQAYFAVLFSARAVLAIDGIYLANPEKIEELLTKWTKQGLYKPEITGEDNPLSDVMQYRIKGNYRLQRLSGPEAAEHVAIQALTFIAADPERLGSFLAASGIGADDVAMPAKPGT